MAAVNVGAGVDVEEPGRSVKVHDFAWHRRYRGQHSAQFVVRGSASSSGWCSTTKRDRGLRAGRGRRRMQVRQSTSFTSLESSMSTGTVKWFNPTKGYGFIQPQGRGQDVFVHISAIEKAGLSTLNEGQKIEFEVVSNRGKSSAENLKVK
jgi:cold shock protein